MFSQLREPRGCFASFRLYDVESGLRGETELMGAVSFGACSSDDFSHDAVGEDSHSASCSWKTLQVVRQPTGRPDGVYQKVGSPDARQCTTGLEPAVASAGTAGKLTTLPPYVKSATDATDFALIGRPVDRAEDIEPAQQIRRRRAPRAPPPPARMSHHERPDGTADTSRLHHGGPKSCAHSP